MAREPLRYGPLEFQTKKQALLWLQRLKDDEIGSEWLPPMDVFQALDVVYRGHPDRWLYPATAPNMFKVVLDPMYRQAMLSAVWYGPPRVSWPFSYKKCVVSLPKKDKIKRALETEVRDQLRAAQDLASGRHEVRYKALSILGLWDIFQGIEKGTLGKLPVVQISDLSQEGDLFWMKDRDLALRWKTFHQEKAKLEAATHEEKRSLEFNMEAGDLQGDLMLGHNP